MKDGYLFFMDSLLFDYVLKQQQRRKKLKKLGNYMKNLFFLKLVFLFSLNFLTVRERDEHKKCGILPLLKNLLFLFFIIQQMFTDIRRGYCKFFPKNRVNKLCSVHKRKKEKKSSKTRFLFFFRMQ